jgi:hypothetical protein
MHTPPCTFPNNGITDVDTTTPGDFIDFITPTEQHKNYRIREGGWVSLFCTAITEYQRMDNL